MDVLEYKIRECLKGVHIEDGTIEAFEKVVRMLTKSIKKHEGAIYEAGCRTGKSTAREEMLKALGIYSLIESLNYED